MNPLDDKIKFDYASLSEMPYSNSEMIDKLNDAYEKAYDKYAFIAPLRASVKQVALSELMTYTHISGVYSFFTGEANINVNYPDFVLPYTAAHEMAHQRGIAREKEANFVAYLVCMESDDDYIRYSAYLNMYEYIISALSKADKGLYTQTVKNLDTDIRYELSAYSDFFDKYRDSKSVNGIRNHKQYLSHDSGNRGNQKLRYGRRSFCRLSQAAAIGTITGIGRKYENKSLKK